MKKQQQQQQKKQGDYQPMVPQVEARLAEIAADRVRLVASRSEFAQRLTAIQETIGEQYLRGDRSGIRQAADVTAEIAAIERALEILEQRDKAAQLDLKRARVSDLQHAAAAKRDELTALEAATAKVLQQLADLEQIPLTASVLSSQPRVGCWADGTNMSPNPPAWKGFHELVPNRPGEKNLEAPKSRLLRMKIEELELEAEALQRDIDRVA